MTCYKHLHELFGHQGYDTLKYVMDTTTGLDICRPEKAEDAYCAICAQARSTRSPIKRVKALHQIGDALMTLSKLSLFMFYNSLLLFFE